MQRQSHFSFACARCGRCCHDQAIQLNAYEIARLAQGLGLSTSQTIAQHTNNAGQFLRFGPDRACAFLRQDGCAVHQHRPLACRLYPLGREQEETEAERFVRLRPHPLCAGQIGEAAQESVADYLEGQGAAPFLQAFDLYQAAALSFLALPAPARALAAAELEWFDQDLALARAGLRELPLDPWPKLELHLAWLDAVMQRAAAKV